MKCHGCNGKGWVDSQYKGPSICPLCNGKGSQNGVGLRVTAYTTNENRNPFLRELEGWLQNHEIIRFYHESKTMNSYTFVSKDGKTRGLVWVSTYGASRIYLFRTQYDAVDTEKKVRYVKTWGGYPQLRIRSREDIEYAIKLIEHVLKSC